MSDLPTKINNSEIQNLILSKLKDLILYKNLEPGDKLPSERVLAEKFGVSRRNIKETIAKLEFYELVKSIPQSGTFLAQVGQTALVGVIENILELKDDDFNSLVETRILLELNTAGWAAERRTKKDLKQIEKRLNQYKQKALKGESAIQEDLLFHLAIAKASGNSTIHTLMSQITPKLISVFEYNRIIFKEKQLLKAKRDVTEEIANKEIDAVEVKRHVAIFEAIKDQKPQLAKKCMEDHFEEVLKKMKTQKITPLSFLKNLY